MGKTIVFDVYSEGYGTCLVLTSVFQTLKQRGDQGTDVVIETLRQYSATKKLTTLPKMLQTAE